MRSLYQPPFHSTVSEKLMLKRQAEEIMRLRGDNRYPEPPRDVQAQSGSRKVLLSWKAPIDDSRVEHYRIYRGDESTLVGTTKDKGHRLFEVATTADATSPVQSFFVSSVSASLLESQKVQVLGSASDESGAPADASPPPGYTDESSGGSDLNTSTPTTNGGAGRGVLA